MNVTSQLPLIRLTPAAWRTSLRAVQEPGQNAADQSDEVEENTAWLELSEGGLATGPRALEPHWKQLIEAAATSRAGFRVVAEQGGMEHRADITLGRINTCLLSRRVNGVGIDGVLTPVKVDPELEFTATAGDPWVLMRSILPPVEALLAPPHQTPASRIRPVDIEPLIDDSVADWSGDESALEKVLKFVKPTAAVLDVLDAQTYVGYAAWCLRDEASPDSATVSFRHWVVGKELYRLGAHGGQTGWLEVQPGDVGFEFTWNRMGLQDVVARPSERGTQ